MGSVVSLRRLILLSASEKSHNRVAQAVRLENWLYWGSIALQLKSTVYSAAWTVTLLTIKDEFRNGERCPELSFSHYCLHLNNSNCQGDCLFSEEPITFSDGPPRLQTVQYAYSRSQNKGELMDLKEKAWNRSLGPCESTPCPFF